MTDIILNYATIIAYIAFSLDVIFQIRRVYKRKSSLDVSWRGIGIRLIGSSVIFIKFLSVGDRALLIGQSIFVTVVVIYLIMAIYFSKLR